MIDLQVQATIKLKKHLTMNKRSVIIL